MEFELIAESGSTRTEWRLVPADGGIVPYETIGMNPFYISEREAYLVVSMNLPDGIPGPSVSRIWFYGAGCWYDEQKKVIGQALSAVFTRAEIHVLPDIFGASRAIFRDDPGLTAVLGTGASTCYYDGGKIASYIKSLGFILGDEGSGAYMGKMLVSKYLRKELPSRIMTEFNVRYGYSFEQLLSAVYSGSFPNRFLAGFSEFINEHRRVPEIEAIILDNFGRFFDQYICKYQEHKSLPLGCVGSVAYFFESYLREQAEKRSIPVAGIYRSAIDELVKYHVGGRS